ncbi:uncharacterized protein BDW43DRAFT_229460 [Aspergillus alliaceus]|uniref:uncharacterized protein n=1 Tax=Petromyces alliaceus TaxID=209559 RepID=UPI0012A72C38|nr:uncharacterized protein BDW43DRAFT_229460 [Aspergillus alliaceus]KAB8237044.1 hypothetical protein BDW43DRAFT_229460 [Aspergillus alliaceus]
MTSGRSPRQGCCGLGPARELAAIGVAGIGTLLLPSLSIFLPFLPEFSLDASSVSNLITFHGYIKRPEIVPWFNYSVSD